MKCRETKQTIKERKRNWTHHHGMQKDENKLSHLQTSEVLLPPQEWTDYRTHGGQEVVRIHDSVYKRVQEGHKGTVATWRVNIRTALICYF